MFPAHGHQRRPLSNALLTSLWAMAPLFPPEIFVSRVLEASSAHPLSGCESSKKSPAVFSHRLIQSSDQGPGQRNYGECAEALTWTVAFSQIVPQENVSPEFSKSKNTGFYSTLERIPLKLLLSRSMIY